jgi:para-nitrobenzyl esterase
MESAMRVGRVAGSVFVAIGIVSSVSAEQTKTVQLVSGTLRGVVSKDSRSLSFKGIPYAKPPLGDLRWQAPQDLDSSSDVWDATDFRDDCMQTQKLIQTRRSEDCLYLNVWQPAGASEPLPVIVWIHGGGYVNGGSSIPIHDGSALAEEGLVVVTLNYRLGRLGFFAHPALFSTNDRPIGNYGLMDQIQALQWVQKHIAKFGGDRTRVTIIGESAGGGAVLHLLTSPYVRRKGLFQRAVIMSGGGRKGLVPARSIASAQADDEGFANSIGIYGKGAEALAALRNHKPEDFLGNLDIDLVVWNALTGMSIPGTPIMDGQIVPDEPGNILGTDVAKMPILVGTTATEVVLFNPSPNNPDPFSYFGADAARAHAVYDRCGLFAPAQISMDISMNEPARFAVKAMTASATPAWLYRFTYVLASIRQQPDECNGALHSTEVPFLFQTLDKIDNPVPISAADWQMARSFSFYLANFAKNGIPNIEAQALPRWPTFDPTTTCLMNFRLDGPAFEPEPRGGVALVEWVASRSRSSPGHVSESPCL